MPSHFAVIAPKVRAFLALRAFGGPVDLDTPELLQAIGQRLVRVVTLRVFIDRLRDVLVQPQQPRLEQPGRALSSLSPFPWSRATAVCRKTVVNKVPCDNKFEEDFARFLDNASDVARFGKLPMNFGFSIPYTDIAGNLRQYYPDFVAVGTDGVHYLVETKGMEDRDVKNKDRSALLWVENATELTGQPWQYVKVRQTEFEQLTPVLFEECLYLGMLQGVLLE